MASPAIRPSRPVGLFDPQQEGEYPIVLGDSLAEDTKSKDAFVNIRYNWQPKSGFLDGRESRMRRSGDRWHLDVSNNGTGSYQYVTLAAQDQSGTSEGGTRPLMLIFDESKSVFVLEAISATLDMNLKTGPGMSREAARDLPQLHKDQQTSKKESHAIGHACTSADDETPDASNPYDFRHFLAEARENVGKSTQAPGAHTPMPGSRTPLSGTSTPAPGGNRFLPTTPQFRPSQTKTTSKPTEQRKNKAETTGSRSTNAATRPAAKRDTTKKDQPLSKATISDSDGSGDETVNVARAPAPAPASKSTSTKQSRPLGAKGHTRNISANIGSSPHIIINDDDGGLEIDMGSPLPEDERCRKRGRVDPEAFRSHTGTPIGGLSSNFRSTSRPISRTPVVDEPARRHGRGRDGDVRMKDIEAASEEDEDDDVEEFELGSPRGKSSAPRRGEVSRDESDDHEQAESRRQAPPTPPAPATAYDEDDEDLLEAALEAALEEESGNQSTGVGLGIGMANGNVQEDESEVSEEE
ncbi:hypothetical protein A1O7_07909 [Cladophialophora yegresii CBS 114405]|uniref:Transcription elongation factor Eaf N-terminal domain-containing protein n=1 Tax=Cladophialophora yegresii CBS 114405 TaxID=1182544 RepID=W9VZ83_9EURO|nr:uncharacterized protein A1O7_07909 [Cladophialophora yegresii CBS 114405]EXJ57561.1 hypothetical protein A1O7_07909 [Cladophialophora yegresii CBS 114405]